MCVLCVFRLRVLNKYTIMNLLNDEISICVGEKSSLGHVVQSLKQWGCCVRCIFRFLGVKSADLFRTYDLTALAACAEALIAGSETGSGNLADTNILDVPGADAVVLTNNGNVTHNKEESVIDPINRTMDSPCVCCFGVLQDTYCQPDFVEQISKAVLEQDYEFKNFLCSISTPVCLVLREHAIWLALDESIPGGFADAEKNGIASVKDVWKWINGPMVASLLGVPFDQKSQFEVLLTFGYSNNDKECGFLYSLYPNVFQRRKQNKHGWEVFNRSNVARAIESTKADIFRRQFKCPPTYPLTFAKVNPITCQHGALFIAGRYNKFSRYLSQTPWVVDGKRKSEFSVEELICAPISKAVLAGEWRFSASGREDVDVRMLGSGRPFVIEFINPRRVNFTVEQMCAMQDTINSDTKDVAVRDLQVVLKEDTAVMKECEEDKMKRYVALCWSRDPVSDDRLASLSGITNVTLQQQTPIRVLHRRTLATRERTVYNMSAERVGSRSNYFALSLSTQAGTYVKEFVHGDLGRTEPSLGTLLDTECDILALDVVGVELDWPKSLG